MDDKTEKLLQEYLTHCVSLEKQKEREDTFEFWMQVAQFVALFGVFYTNAYSMNGVHVPQAISDFLNNIPFPTDAIVYSLYLFLAIFMLITIYKMFKFIHRKIRNNF